MRELLSRTLVGLIAGVTFLCGAPAPAQQYNGKELVKATLIADVSSIQPGQRFQLGVVYGIEPGWHIYWKYSGDSGIPTKIEWQLPEGFTIQDLQWPVPLREKEPGDLEVFAYTSEVLLFADVVAPATLPPGPFTIQARSDWLVCQSLCVPGHAQLSLTLSSGANTASDSAKIFENYASKVPRDLTNPIGFSRVGKNFEIEIPWAPNGASLDFFPIPPADAVIGHVVRDRNKLTLAIDTDAKPISRMDGVLIVGTGESRLGYEVNGHSPVTALHSGGSTSTVSLGGILQALGFAMLGGLILNVMPCVLPVISLKIFVFVSEAGERPEKAFWLSMAFSLGIISCFAILAAIWFSRRDAVRRF